MQPEDIIQAKEWQQLTNAERKAVEPLAFTEGEYNVLKMLLIVQEDAENVPAINPSIQQHLHTYLNKPAERKSGMFWYAAASIIVIAFAAFFLLQPKKQEQIAITLTTNQAKQNAADTLKKEPALNLPSPVDEPTEIVRQQKTKPTMTTPDIKLNTNSNLSDIAQVNTSVSENENLLDFVTEVY